MNQQIFKQALETMEVRNGIEIFSLPVKKTIVFCLELKGEKFIFLNSKIQGEERENLIHWALEQYENDTLRPVRECAKFFGEDAKIVGISGEVH